MAIVIRQNVNQLLCDNTNNHPQNNYCTYNDGNNDLDDVKQFLDINLGKFFFSCNIPFRVVENKYFVDFIVSLTKCGISYKPPSRKFLASTVLRKVHEKIELERQNHLQGTPSVLLIDDWRNKSVNRKFLVSTVRNKNVHQTFLTFSDISTDKEDGEFLSDFIEEAIVIAKEKYNTDIYAIVSDNDSKIVRGGRLARTVERKELWQSTCASHSGNLLLKSIVDNVLLEQIRGTELKNYPDKRFGYVRDSCVSIIRNIELLRQISEFPDVNINDNIVELLHSENFERKLRETIENLDPIYSYNPKN
ncbi:uncharacterized protein LOC111642859 [Copidosoma floridanum]|uniref:uncharacterized protein LOC111642859 n=1 Tax=Copidosoma floridanum TaxID=29053 RepID=UPI000C6FCB6F|nr:uncharacterized protein LOC111642859 [Copidosoma floridanum]